MCFRSQSSFGLDFGFDISFGRIAFGTCLPSSRSSLISAKLDDWLWTSSFELFQSNVPMRSLPRSANPLGDPAFLVRKLQNRSCAILTVSDPFAGKKFFKQHGSDKDAKTPAVSPLRFLQKNVYCSATKTPSDRFVVQSLQQQEEERRQRKRDDIQKEAKPTANGENVVKHKRPRHHTFAIESIACGQWNYYRDRLTFLECYSDPRRGSIIFGKSLVVFLHKTAQQTHNIRIDID